MISGRFASVFGEFSSQKRGKSSPLFSRHCRFCILLSRRSGPHRSVARRLDRGKGSDIYPHRSLLVGICSTVYTLSVFFKSGALKFIELLAAQINYSILFLQNLRRTSILRHFHLQAFRFWLSFLMVLMISLMVLWPAGTGGQPLCWWRFSRHRRGNRWDGGREGKNFHSTGVIKRWDPFWGNQKNANLW